MKRLQKSTWLWLEMANNFNHGVDKDDIDERLEVVPEELTNEGLLELEKERIAEEQAREGNS